MTDFSQHMAKEIAQKELNLLKLTSEKQLTNAMISFAEKYHRHQLQKLRSLDDIELILRYYYLKYRHDSYSKRHMDIAKVIYNYFVGSEKSKMFLKDLPNKIDKLINREI